MSFLIVVVLAALLVPLLTRGSYERLLETRWRAVPLLAIGVGLQVVLELVDLSPARAADVGYGVLVASYVLVIGFLAANLLVRGMAIVLLGVALNAFVIFVNQGMPVDPPDAWRAEIEITTTAKHHPYGEHDRFRLLADIVPVPGFATIVSFGDLIMAVGLLDVAYHASRRARPRTRSHHDTQQPTIDLATLERNEAETSDARGSEPSGDASQRVEHL